MIITGFVSRHGVLILLIVGHECDLAVLTVSDDDFWTGTTPLKFGQLPDLLEVSSSLWDGRHHVEASSLCTTYY